MAYRENPYASHAPRQNADSSWQNSPFGDASGASFVVTAADQANAQFQTLVGPDTIAPDARFNAIEGYHEQLARDWQRGVDHWNYIGADGRVAYREVARDGGGTDAYSADGKFLGSYVPGEDGNLVFHRATGEWQFVDTQGNVTSTAYTTTNGAIYRDAQGNLLASHAVGADGDGVWRDAQGNTYQYDFHGVNGIRPPMIATPNVMDGAIARKDDLDAPTVGPETSIPKVKASKGSKGDQQKAPKTPTSDGGTVHDPNERPENRTDFATPQPGFEDPQAVKPHPAWKVSPYEAPDVGVVLTSTPVADSRAPSSVSDYPFPVAHGHPMSDTPLETPPSTAPLGPSTDGAREPAPRLRIPSLTGGPKLADAAPNIFDPIKELRGTGDPVLDGLIGSYGALTNVVIDAINGAAMAADSPFFLMRALGFRTEADALSLYGASPEGFQALQSVQGALQGLETALGVAEAERERVLNDRARNPRDQMVELGILNWVEAKKVPIAVTEPNVPGTPKIITVGSQAAYDALSRGQVRLQPGEVLGLPPRFGPDGYLLEESHVEGLGAESAREMFGARGGRIGTIPRQ